MKNEYEDKNSDTAKLLQQSSKPINLDKFILTAALLIEMKTEYPAKVLLAWGEAISGNNEIMHWLIQNGYPELGLFRYALLWDMKARQWFIDNGYPELMAMIKGVEGDQGAIRWLDKVGHNILAKMARSGDGDEQAFEQLSSEGHKILALVSKRIYKVKTDLDEDRKDPHKFTQF